MEGACRPPLRWRCCCQSWVDPVEEEALRHTHEGRLPVEINQTNRDDEKAESIGFVQEMIFTNNAKKYEHDPVVGNRLSIRTKVIELQESKRDPSMAKAKSQLYQICAANCWNPPSFTLSKEEGSDHQKRFTYKVMIEVDTITTTILECFSEPKPQKQAAEEHAAEAALCGCCEEKVVRPACIPAKNEAVTVISYSLFVHDYKLFYIKKMLGNYCLFHCYFFCQSIMKKPNGKSSLKTSESVWKRLQSRIPCL